jgi:glycosyltransferase involved in cell wall biosynthesis
MQKEIAFIIPYPIGFAPSQRFRFEQYFNILKDNNYKPSYFPFLTKKDFNLLYQPGNYFLKSWSIVKGFFKRLILMFALNKYDIIFIHREASPIGPPIFEWIIAKVLKKKIIYDFDDAIWLENTSLSNKLVSTIKRHSKVSSICKWSKLVMCGNHFLMDFAKKHTSNVVYVPTTIDTINTHNQQKKHLDGVITIGWTGTHSTIKYLQEIEILLAKTQKRILFKFIVISNKDPMFKLLNYKYIPWEKENEIKDLLKLDIGLMPLIKDEWTKGKCGFKALQYMALGIPTIASPVGVNSEIIDDRINGYLAVNSSDWSEKISLLNNSSNLRGEIGLAGKKTVLENYSVNSNQGNYLNHFNRLVHN